MASIQFDHVGVVVHDLEATAQFFVDRGFHREGPIEVSGEWVDRVVGLEGVHREVNGPAGRALSRRECHRPGTRPGLREDLAGHGSFR